MWHWTKMSYKGISIWREREKERDVSQINYPLQSKSIFVLHNIFHPLTIIRSNFDFLSTIYFAGEITH